jgi:hypothetical protein
MFIFQFFNKKIEKILFYILVNIVLCIHKMMNDICDSEKKCQIMGEFLEPKFKNPLELFLNIFPINGHIFGSFAVWLGFNIKFHQNDDLKIPQDKAIQFLKSGSDIDASIQNYQDEIPKLIKIMKLFGDVIIIEEEGITKLEWECKNFPTLSIDIVHIYNTESVDFTVNNWVMTKSKDYKWDPHCRVTFVRHKPELTDQNILEICTEDILNKKINLMISPEREISQRPKIVARTYKLLNRGYTFREKMITPMIIKIDRFQKKHLHNNDLECPLCLELYENNLAVLDCGHALHPTCMQKYFVTLHKDDAQNLNIVGPRVYSRYMDPIPIKNQVAPKFRCPLCRHDSTFC